MRYIFTRMSEILKLQVRLWQIMAQIMADYRFNNLKSTHVREPEYGFRIMARHSGTAGNPARKIARIVIFGFLVGFYVILQDEFVKPNATSFGLTESRTERSLNGNGRTPSEAALA
jgi:hypothetical protein